MNPDHCFPSLRSFQFPRLTLSLRSTPHIHPHPRKEQVSQEYQPNIAQKIQ